MSISRDIKSQFIYGNVINQLIIVNVALFLLVNIFRLTLLFRGYDQESLTMKFHESMQILQMPLDFNEFIYKPWTLITHMFLHVHLGHIFFNMLFLYFIGRIFQDMSGAKRVLVIYVLGAILGAILQSLATNFIPGLHPKPGEIFPVMMGASGGVMALVVASATLVPDFELNLILFRVRLKYFVLFYIVVDLIGISYFDNTAHFAHLGGALFGFFFVIQLRKGRDLSKGFNKVISFLKNPFSRKSRMKVAYLGSGSKRSVSDEKINESKILRQKKVDEILDKISKSGYESLTKEEKDFLFKASKNV